MSDLANLDSDSAFDPWSKEPRLGRALGVIADIEDILRPMIEDLGYELVRAQLQGDQKPTLQIMAEPRDGTLMTVEGCSKISFEASALLDVEDLISAAYTLEVSSPGLDRPLTRPFDFTRWQGYEARIETHILIEDRRRFKGILAGWQEQSVLLDCEEGTYVIAFSDISRAKLLLSDELVKDATKGRLPGIGPHAETSAPLHSENPTQEIGDTA